MNIFERASRWCLLAIAFLLPFWFLPVTSAPVEFNKALMVSVLVIVSFVLYLINSIVTGRVVVGFHWIFIIMGLLLALWFTSSLVSRAGDVSLWGLGAEPNSFFSVLICVVMAWLIAMLFPDEASLKKIFKWLILGSAIFATFTLLSYFGVTARLGGIMALPAFNTIGSWNSVALAAGFFIMMLFPFMVGSGGNAWFFVLIFAALLLVVGIVNFPLTWVLLGFFALTYISYSIWRRKIGGMALVVTILLLSVSIFGFVFRDTVAGAVRSNAPIEVGVSHRATFDVIKQALKENIFFGKGPGTFGYLWDLYKPGDVNRTVFWNVRFTSGSSYLLSVLGEIGLLGWFVFIAFLGGLWHLGLRLVTSIATERRALYLSAFFMFSYTLLMWAFYPAGYTLIVLGFFTSGLMLASFRAGGIMRVYDVLLFGEGPLGFVSAMALVLLMIGGLGGFYSAGSRYAGQILFARGVNVFNSSGNIDAAERAVTFATRLDQRNDLYFRTLSQIHMFRGEALLQDQSTPRELLGSKFKDVLDRAVSASQSAIAISPLDAGNHRALGKIYEFLVSLGTEGASAAADTQYSEALKRAPKNPSLYRDKALVYLVEAAAKKNQELLKKAENELLKSLELKPDYAEGQFLLTQVYDAAGNEAEAIKRGEAAALLSPNDIGSLFQLGLLYYKSNRLSDAEVIFRRSVLINQNYSNARYFLGLIYDRMRRKFDAISEFEKIASLNPGNQEVKQILRNLNGGKNALVGISPPGPSPERRIEAPVKEDDRSSTLKGRVSE